MQLPRTQSLSIERSKHYFWLVNHVNFGGQTSNFFKVVDEKFIELHKKGASLRETSKATGRSKSSIRERLIETGHTMRPSCSNPASKWKSGSSPSAPPYGFSFHQGQFVEDVKEQFNLKVILELWNAGKNPSTIARILNSRGILSRRRKSWSSQVIRVILKRLSYRP